MNLGTTTIDVVSDGTFLMDGGCLFGQIPKTEWELQIKPDRRNRIRLALNCMLIQTPEFNVLVDTGVGSKRQDKMKEMIRLNGNKLLKGLKAKGITARDIDAVILSNLHFDHSGGCTKLDRSGTPVPTFPKLGISCRRAAGRKLIHLTSATGISSMRTISCHLPSAICLSSLMTSTKYSPD